MDVLDKSFETASETSKLLITLSTGAVGVGLAILNAEEGKKTALIPSSGLHKTIVTLSLASFVISAAFGVWTQLGLTHVLSDSSHSTPDVWDKRITLPMQLQIIDFLAGLVLFVAYGILRLTA